MQFPAKVHNVDENPAADDATHSAQVRQMVAAAGSTAKALVCIYANVCVCECVCVHMYITCLYICMFVYLYVFMYIRMYI